MLPFLMTVGLDQTLLILFSITFLVLAVIIVLVSAQNIYYPIVRMTAHFISNMAFVVLVRSCNVIIECSIVCSVYKFVPCLLVCL